MSAVPCQSMSIVVYAGVTLTEVMPLALKRHKSSAVKSKLKIRNPEEESLMEKMSRSSAQEMVTSLISDHIRQDQKAVLDLIGESLPPQEKGIEISA